MSRKYYGSSPAFTPPATPTDVALIGGAANRTVRVQKIWISSTQTTAGQNFWAVQKRPTANTGGTSSNIIAVSADSRQTPAEALVIRYSGNPTIGATQNIWRGWIASPAPASVVTYQPVVLDLEDGVVLVTADEQIAVNFGGVALPAGLSVSIGFEWTEI